jgi:hypothetical protein
MLHYTSTGPSVGPIQLLIGLMYHIIDSVAVLVAHLIIKLFFSCATH